MNLSTFTPILDVLYQRTYMPVAIYNLNDELCFPDSQAAELFKKQAPYLFEQDEYPIHIVNNYQFLAASFLHEFDQIPYRIVLGPCIILGANVKQRLFHGDISAYTSCETQESFLEYCKSFYTLVTQKEITKQIPIRYMRNQSFEQEPKGNFEHVLYERRSVDATHDSYQFELRFLDYVKRGKKDKIDWVFSKINKTYTVHLAQDSLESAKLKFASIVTLLTRTAIDCKVPLDSAFSLSDSLIQGLHRILNAQECVRYMQYAAYEFSDLIQSSTTKQCSTLIGQCLSYIDTHLYDKITLQELSDLTGKSSVYISSRFKKEMELSLSDYILGKKIEEAKQLLLFTDHSFQEISTLLNFTSQSHFTQRFKQITGQTPKAFRNMNFQYL